MTPLGGGIHLAIRNIRYAGERARHERRRAKTDNSADTS